MTEAIFGLAGVVLGGLLNGGVTWLGERQRSRGEIKVAARLVVSELEMVEVASTSALETSNYGQLTFGSNAAWLEHRATLATTLTDEEWSALDNCFMFVVHMLNSAESGEKWNEDSKRCWSR